MSFYLPRAKTGVMFDGENVTVSINRISVRDAMSFNTGEDRVKMAENTETLLRKYDVKFEGLKDSEGAEVPIDKVFSEFYFSALVGAAADLLMSTGSVPPEAAAPLGVRST